MKLKLIGFFSFSLFCLGNLFSQTNIAIKVDGMSCSFCVNSIEKKLKPNKEIKNISIDLKKGWVTFTIAKDMPIDKIKYKDLIENAGYSVRNILQNNEATIQINELKLP